MYTIFSIYVFCNKVNHFRAKFISFIIIPVPPSIIRTNKNKVEGERSHVFRKQGWYVKELKKLGIRTYEGKKLESYRTHVLSSLLERMKKASA
ncbi:hypothetical protein RBTH_03915 [Bacillus thuringiensis serovar israelensis ATCC 35646]|nr:hypothetical protein RBTH_03915 [Bacillus thuringiensis serovar israelensis ATCC 35646]